MTNRELLELAAKAAGIAHEGVTDEGACILKPDRSWSHYWNPRADDGDALRLLTKMPFRELYVSEIGATVSWRRDGGTHGYKCDEYASEHGGDLNAATRLAIVRAAAEIGKAMT